MVPILPPQNLPVLYRHLIPPKKKDLKIIGLKKKVNQKPPLLRCGYLAEKELLFGYARRHGLLQECPGESERETVLLELDTIWVIALYNNYSMKTIPPHEDIQELARFLGKEQEQPKWYFDATEWRWK